MTRLEIVLAILTDTSYWRKKTNWGFRPSEGIRNMNKVYSTYATPILVDQPSNDLFLALQNIATIKLDSKLPKERHPIMTMWYQIFTRSKSWNDIQQGKIDAMLHIIYDDWQQHSHSQQAIKYKGHKFDEVDSQNTIPCLQEETALEISPFEKGNSERISSQESIPTITYLKHIAALYDEDIYQPEHILQRLLEPYLIEYLSSGIGFFGHAPQENPISASSTPEQSADPHKILKKIISTLETGTIPSPVQAQLSGLLHAFICFFPQYRHIIPETIHDKLPPDLSPLDIYVNIPLIAKNAIRKAYEQQRDINQKIISAKSDPDLITLPERVFDVCHVREQATAVISNYHRYHSGQIKLLNHQSTTISQELLEKFIPLASALSDMQLKDCFTSLGTHTQYALQYFLEILNGNLVNENALNLKARLLNLFDLSFPDDNETINNAIANFNQALFDNTKLESACQLLCRLKDSISEERKKIFLSHLLNDTPGPDKYVALHFLAEFIPLYEHPKIAEFILYNMKNRFVFIHEEGEDPFANHFTHNNISNNVDILAVEYERGEVLFDTHNESKDVPDVEYEIGKDPFDTHHESKNISQPIFDDLSNNPSECLALSSFITSLSTEQQQAITAELLTKFKTHPHNTEIYYPLGKLKNILSEEDQATIVNSLIHLFSHENYKKHIGFRNSLHTKLVAVKDLISKEQGITIVKILMQQASTNVFVWSPLEKFGDDLKNWIPPELKNSFYESLMKILTLVIDSVLRESASHFIYRVLGRMAQLIPEEQKPAIIQNMVNLLCQDTCGKDAADCLRDIILSASSFAEQCYFTYGILAKGLQTPASEGYGYMHALQTCIDIHQNIATKLLLQNQIPKELSGIVMGYL